MNAGHLPPAILRDGEITTLSATGLPLGLFCEARYSACSVHLDPGDVLVFYTDGLTEARNATDEEFGRERLLASLKECHKLRPQDVAKRCIGDLGRFLAGTELTDDLTVMVVRRSI